MISLGSYMFVLYFVCVSFYFVCFYEVCFSFHEMFYFLLHFQAFHIIKPSMNFFVHITHKSSISNKTLSNHIIFFKTVCCFLFSVADYLLNSSCNLFSKLIGDLCWKSCRQYSVHVFL
jgi:hypothetical protein